MSDVDDPNASRSGPASSNHRRGRGRRLFWAAVIVLILLAVVLVPAARHHTHEPLAVWGSASHLLLDRENRTRRATERILDRVDATEEQRRAIREILSDLTSALAALDVEHDALRDRIRLALRADPMDRKAFEQVRTGALDLADRASRQAVDAIARSLEVLTPEQRARLAETWRQRR